MSAWWFVVVAALVIVAIIVFRDMRPGGVGPPLMFIPRRFRARVNSIYLSRGWQAPFDE